MKLLVKSGLTFSQWPKRAGVCTLNKIASKAGLMSLNIDKKTVSTKNGVVFLCSGLPM